MPGDQFAHLRNDPNPPLPAVASRLPDTITFARDRSHPPPGTSATAGLKVEPDLSNGRPDSWRKGMAQPLVGEPVTARKPSANLSQTHSVRWFPGPLRSVSCQCAGGVFACEPESRRERHSTPGLLT